MATKTVTKDTFQSDVLGASKPVVVDFWAEWCGPCKMIAPSLEEISEENSNVEIAKVNIDENQELAVQFGIRSIPTLMMFKDGQHVDTLMGAQSKSKLASWIESAK
ncbi:thioredoxin [Fulvimarina sp. MAC3]|uniref:thioredoxin n=1 Tax=Fulvimarina sp. MAC3 TaxID=3148887 RepID=UPI0031FC4C94